MGWYAEYNNEGYDLSLLDSNGRVVATASDTFSNVTSYKKITVNWDTSGYRPGRYKVEVTLKFYSLYRWNEAPTKRCLYLNLVCTNHSWDSGTITKKPTISSSGVKTYTCAKCGATQNESIPPVQKPVAQKLATPSIKKLENVNGGIKLTWGKVSGAAKYRVFVKNGSSWVRLTDTTSTSFTWNKAVSGKSYTFTVRCLSKDGKSYTSGYNTAGKSIKYIAAPVLTGAKSVSSGIQVTWKKSAGAAKYRIYRKIGSGSWQRVGDTTGVSFVDKTAKKGVKYTYTVRCITSNGKAYTSGFNTTGKTVKR